MLIDLINSNLLQSLSQLRESFCCGEHLTDIEQRFLTWGKRTPGVSWKAGRGYTRCTSVTVVLDITSHEKVSNTYDDFYIFT